MHMRESIDATNAATFGRRRVAPHACVADDKPHIRSFLLDALEELGFIASQCDRPAGLAAFVLDRRPDLFVLGLSGGGIAANETLETLRRINFAGKVMLFGPRASLMVSALQNVGETLGLSMLPLLPTPFSDTDLRDRVRSLLPAEMPPNPPVDVAEALHVNWLELWYQPKIQTRTLTMTGAEALIRMRHPSWGVVPPACFLPDVADPHFQTLSEFVVSRAIGDWRNFVTEYGHVEISINLPVAFFEHPLAVETLARQMPAHPAFEGLIVEIDGSEIVRNLALAKRVAQQLRHHNIAIAIDDLGADWPLLMELEDFPFVEIKIDRKFVSGFADDRLKQVVCRQILELADGFGARTVAVGVETRADFLTARELGFELIQGFFFAKPMLPDKFSRRVLGRPVTIQN
jgi:EAL domain-containing protein (putative c-di-GMP-specific phosphodiesterase class I)/CheY-like chemotaxis protein